MKAVPRRLDERDAPPAQTDNGQVQPLQRAELVISLVRAGVIRLVGQQVATAGKLVAAHRRVAVGGRA